MITIDSRSRLLLLVGVLLAIGFGGGSIINYQITRASVHKAIVQRDLPLTMNNIYSDISAELTRPLLVASSMAADTFLKDWVMDGEVDETRVRKYLLEIREKYNFFSTFFVSAHSGRYYHFRGLHKVIDPGDSHDVWYYRFIGSEQPFDLDVDTDEAGTNMLTVFVNYRLEDEAGRLLGVTGVGVKVESMAKLVGDYRRHYDRNVFLTDRAGVVQVHPDTSLIERTTITELTGGALSIPERIGDALQTESFSYLQDGSRIVGNFRYIDNMDWLLFVEQNETEALREARMNFLRAIAIGLCTSAVVMGVTLVTVNRYQRLLEELAVSDELTGLANRRKLEEEFDKFISRSERSGHPFGLVLMDLDKFKTVNDTMGHLHGDDVLRRISCQLAAIIRPTDILARWGGDEFALLAEGSTEDLLAIAERIRQNVESIEWPDGVTQGQDPRREVSISLGVATSRTPERFTDLLHRADTALYRCKDRGGNRVESPA